MNDLILSSKNIVIVGIKKKTSATFFRELKIGDVIKIELTLVRNCGVAAAGIYQNKFVVENVNSGRWIKISHNNLLNRLKCFEYAIPKGVIK